LLTLYLKFDESEKKISSVVQTPSVIYRKERNKTQSNYGNQISEVTIAMIRIL